MSLSEQQRQDIADSLRDAEQGCSPIQPLAGAYPGLDVEDAYSIQTLNIERRLSAGSRIVGRKVGLTGAKMQDLHGLDQYDFGVLLDTMVESNGGTVDVSRFCMPRVEIEIAFLLSESLVGPGITTADVLAATQAVAASIEIIDSRIADWRITLVDTIADNASSCAMVLGPWVPLGDLQLAEVTAELLLDGEVVCGGTGASVMGHPAASVAWLANTVGSFGAHLAAGDVVLPGSCTRAFDVKAGSRVEGRFTELGTVSVNFN